MSGPLPCASPVAASPRESARRDGALMGRVQDKVAIVIGAAQPEGIGAGIARRLAEEGALVTIADVDTVNGPATAALLSVRGRVAFRPVDVASRAANQA